MREAVLSFAEACGVTEAVRVDIALAVGEACSNVVMHAYVGAPAPGSLTVEASHPSCELVVAVRDEGRGMLPRPDSPGLGLGLSIMGRLSSRQLSRCLGFPSAVRDVDRLSNGSEAISARPFTNGGLRLP